MRDTRRRITLYMCWRRSTLYPSQFNLVASLRPDRFHVWRTLWKHYYATRHDMRALLHLSRAYSTRRRSFKVVFTRSTTGAYVVVGSVPSVIPMQFWDRPDVDIRKYKFMTCYLAQWRDERVNIRAYAWTPPSMKGGDP